MAQFCFLNIFLPAVMTGCQMISWLAVLLLSRSIKNLYSEPFGDVEIHGVFGVKWRQVRNIYEYMLTYRLPPDNKFSHGFHKAESSCQTECCDLEFLSKNVAVQISICRECMSLLLLVKGSSDTTCVKCEQVEDPFSMMAELKEERERLRSIRKCEQEIDW